MTSAIIIPARYESTRLPGKPLAKIAGKEMIAWVVEVALKSKLKDKVIIATEEQRIFDFIKEKFPVTDVVITSKDHKSGTDRICEVVKRYSGIKYIVNFQGDEPLMPPAYIDKVFESLLNSKSAIVSLVTPIKDKEDLTNPNIVKAVMDKNRFALYFSRSMIPYDRSSQIMTHRLQPYFRHLGIYGYSRETLLQFSSLDHSSLELCEQLEQLRALENGIKIKLEVVEKAFPAVDTQEDIKIVENCISFKR